MLLILYIQNEIPHIRHSKSLGNPYNICTAPIDIHEYKYVQQRILNEKVIMYTPTIWIPHIFMMNIFVVFGKLLLFFFQYVMRLPCSVCESVFRSNTTDNGISGLESGIYPTDLIFDMPHNLHQIDFKDTNKIIYIHSFVSKYTYICFLTDR